MENQNKIIVITGASRGLGKEIAFRLAAGNNRLILIARDRLKLRNAADEIESVTGNTPIIIPIDISVEEEVVNLSKVIREKFGKIDVLINNAGIGIHKPFEKMCSEEMRKQFEVNFFGAFYCIKSLLPLIRESKNGYILNVGSLVSKVSFPDNCVYAATKSAIFNFTEGLRVELKNTSIKVGLFLPGVLNTGFCDNNKIKPPDFFILDIKRAAAVVEKMIINRKSKVYLYKWMLLPMKLKRMFY